MKKYIWIVVALLAIGLITWKLTEKPKAVEEVPVVTQNELPLHQDSAGQASSTPVTNTERDSAWAVLQKYLGYAKANDVKGLATLSYQLSDSCKNYSASADDRKDCDAKMQSVYKMGSQFKKSDYGYTWSDSKQIILSTAFYRSDPASDVAGYLHGIIFFVKDAGAIKVLSFNPVRGIFLPKSATTTPAEIEQKLIAAVKDADQDGMEDQVENCIRVDTACTKTDPTKRDTNGNGFWDGVEALFYK